MPFVIGLTGGIASGKTAASNTFKALGIDIVDADVIAREVVAPNQPALIAIQDYFGKELITPTGELDRAALRKRVFENQADQEWLNGLLHPAIRERMMAQINASQSAYVILVVPLLIENGLQALTNRVLVIDVPETTQLKRAVERDKCEENVIKNIMKSQADRQHRLELADDVVVNDKDLSHLQAQINVLHKNYLTLSAK